MTQQPFNELNTSGGYPYDEALSALRKEIERGNEKKALYWAIELDSKFSIALWKNLVSIATQDIGFANPGLVQTVCTMYLTVLNLWKDNKEYDRSMLSFVVLSMARSQKSREAENAIQQMLRERRTGAFVIEIPDYAIDFFTRRGRSLKKTEE